MPALQSVIELLSTGKRLEIDFVWLLFLTLFVVLFVPLTLMLWKLKIKSKAASVMIGAVSILAIVNYIGLAIFYLTIADFADPAEANVTAVSWLLQSGKVLYPKLDAAERYINNYGPFSYIINGLFLNLLKPSFFSAKIAGVLSGLTSLFLIFLIAKQRLNFRYATIVCAITSLCFLALTSASGLVTSSFWVRPDSLLLVCTTLGLLAALRGNRSVAVAVSAIALGVSTNLKVTAFLHFLPIYVLLYHRFGVAAMGLSLIGSVFVAALPFAAPQISLRNYWTWLQQVKQKGINAEQMVKNLLWIGFVALPIAIAAIQLPSFRALKQWLWHHRLYCLALTIGIVANAVISSTRGALENNMLPFVPLLVYLFSDLLRSILDFENANTLKIAASIQLSAAIAVLISLILAVYSTESGLISRLASAPGYRAVDDIEQFMKLNPNRSIGIGYGAVSYQLSTYRPALVFAGHPYLLDSASLMEMQASGLNNTPAATLTALRNCQTEIWLIPKNNPPFQVYSYYPPLQKLFSDRFRKTFLDTYDRQTQTEFYDAWVCKKLK